MSYKGVTLQLLWLEYRELHPDGYGYSQFGHRYRTWRRYLDVVMRFIPVLEWVVLPAKRSADLTTSFTFERVLSVILTTPSSWCQRS